MMRTGFVYCTPDSRSSKPSYSSPRINGPKLAEAAPEATLAPVTVGAGEGERLADFTTDLIGGGEFHLAEEQGRVVVINLWATYCAPCVEELPHFEALAEAHPDDLTVLAIHHKTGAKKAEKYLADKGWDHIRFTRDSADKGLFDLVNGSEAMPQTIVLNREGEVIYNAQAPVTYAQLEALYARARG